MGVICGLSMGIGVFLIWWSCWSTPQKNAKPEREPRIAVALRKAGMPGITPSAFTGVSILSGILTGMVLFALTGVWSFSFLGVGAGFVMPRIIVNHRAKVLDSKLWQLWPDAVDHLRSAIRAGLSLPEALIQLSYRGPYELREAFARFGSDYRATGDFVSSLNRLKEYVADPVADNIVEALKIAREVGGSDLGRLLGTLSNFLRENARTRAELQARQSWTVNAARLACVAPWVVLTLMATQPAVRNIYNSFAGFALMFAGAGLSMIAYRLMLRIGALPQERRVFA